MVTHALDRAEPRRPAPGRRPRTALTPLPRTGRELLEQDRFIRLGRTARRIFGDRDAILLQEIADRCRLSRAHGRNEIDGRFYTYDSLDALATQLGWSRNKVQRALRSLRDHWGVVRSITLRGVNHYAVVWQQLDAIIAAGGVPGAAAPAAPAPPWATDQGRFGPADRAVSAPEPGPFRPHEQGRFGPDLNLPVEHHQHTQQPTAADAARTRAPLPPPVADDHDHREDGAPLTAVTTRREDTPKREDSPPRRVGGRPASPAAGVPAATWLVACGRRPTPQQQADLDGLNARALDAGRPDALHDAIREYARQGARPFSYLTAIFERLLAGGAVGDRPPRGRFLERAPVAAGRRGDERLGGGFTDMHLPGPEREEKGRRANAAMWAGTLGISEAEAYAALTDDDAHRALLARQGHGPDPAEEERRRHDAIAAEPDPARREALQGAELNWRTHGIPPEESVEVFLHRHSADPAARRAMTLFSRRRAWLDEQWRAAGAPGERGAWSREGGWWAKATQALPGP